MNLKRAIWVGLLTYVLSFIFGLVVMFFLGVDPAQTSEIPRSFLIILILVSLVFAGLFSLFYFKDKKIKPSAKEGFLFGLVLVAVGFILDVIIFGISNAFTETQQDLIAYYSDPLFWVALILFVAVTTIVGALKKRK